MLRRILHQLDDVLFYPACFDDFVMYLGYAYISGVIGGDDGDDDGDYVRL